MNYTWEKRVECRICGEKNALSSTTLCNGCWEVDTRIDYLIRTGNTKYLMDLRKKLDDELTSRQ